MSAAVDASCGRHVASMRPGWGRAAAGLRAAAITPERREACGADGSRHNARMVAVTSEAELLACFRRIDRRDVELAPDLHLPLEVDDVFAWTVGPRAFLLLGDRPDAPLRGIVFHRSPGVQAHITAMCEWCRLVRGQGAIKLMSVSADRRRSIGVYVCSDLACLARARELPHPASAGRTLRRISAFASRCID
jgi:hypothetical protein